MPKKNIKSEKPIKKYILSVLIGLLVFLICVSVFSLLALKTPYPKENTLFQALVSVAVASFASSFFFVIKQRANGLVSGLIIGFILLVLLFLIFITSSSFKLNESSLLLIPACLLPSAIAGIFAVNVKKR